jgi:hypothetical protein
VPRRQKSSTSYAGLGKLVSTSNFHGICPLHLSVEWVDIDTGNYPLTAILGIISFINCLLAAKVTLHISYLLVFMAENKHFRLKSCPQIWQFKRWRFSIENISFESCPLK